MCGKNKSRKISNTLVIANLTNFLARRRSDATYFIVLSLRSLRRCERKPLKPPNSTRPPLRSFHRTTRFLLRIRDRRHPTPDKAESTPISRAHSPGPPASRPPTRGVSAQVCFSCKNIPSGATRHLLRIVPDHPKNQCQKYRQTVSSPRLSNQGPDFLSCAVSRRWIVSFIRTF